MVCFPGAVKLPFSAICVKCIKSNTMKPTSTPVLQVITCRASICLINRDLLKASILKRILLFLCSGPYPTCITCLYPCAIFSNSSKLLWNIASRELGFSLHRLKVIPLSPASLTMHKLISHKRLKTVHLLHPHLKFRQRKVSRTCAELLCLQHLTRKD